MRLDILVFEKETVVVVGLLTQPSSDTSVGQAVAKLNECIVQR